MTLSYLAFDLLVFVPPLALLALATRPHSRRRVVVLAVLVTLTVIYATPWDNYLVARGVWTSRPAVVVARLGHVPLGEYAVFVLQPLLTGLWVFALGFTVEADVGTAPFPSRPVGGGVWFALALVGGALVSTTTAGYYLGALLLWVAPVLGLEWVFGGPALWRYRREQVYAVAVPTLYLWVVDALALSLGVWSVAEETTLGFVVFGVPLEEAIFFFLTNLLLVHGLVLVRWVFARIEATERAR